MADTPQNSETAAREALAIVQAMPVVDIDIYGMSTTKANRLVSLLYGLVTDLTLARPASSPGEVTDAMVKQVGAILRLYGEFGTTRAREIEQSEAAARDALTAALLSTTQTED